MERIGWHPPEYGNRDEYIDDLHEQWLAQMSERDRRARWWRINWPVVFIATVLSIAPWLWAWSR